MSKPITIEWKKLDLEAICKDQTTPGAGNLIINGTEATLNSDVPYFSYVNLERKIALASAGDISGVHFTVHGTLRGLPVSEGPFDGPDGTGFIETEGFFTTVTSIEVDNLVGFDVSVGTGTEGHTIWLRSDYHRSVNNLTVAVDVIGGDITYTFETSIDDPIASGEAFIVQPIDGVTIPTIPVATGMINATETSIANYTWPTHSSRVRVSSSDSDGALAFYFLQQGQV